MSVLFYAHLTEHRFCFLHWDDIIVEAYTNINRKETEKFMDILGLIGGLCLFLFGMNLMGSYLEKSASISRRRKRTS